RVAGLVRLTAWVGLVLVAIPFAVQHVRVGLHPALAAEQGGGDMGLLEETFAPGARFGAIAGDTPAEAPTPPPAAPETTRSEVLTGEGKPAPRRKMKREI